MRSNRVYKQGFNKIVFLILPLSAFLMFVSFPLYWIFITAFKPESEIMSRDVSYWPRSFTLQNFAAAWKNAGFSIYFKNSLLMSLIGIVLIVTISILTGYCLARFQFKGKSLVYLILLCTQFIPGAMLLTPMFIMFKNLHLLNNVVALALINTTFQIPFNSILMSGFVGGIDYGIEEAAQIDGCSRMGALVRVVLPLLKPGIVTVAAYSFIACWNEFLFAYMFISKQDRFTLSVGLKSLMGEYAMNYGQLAAGAVMAVIPVAVLFTFMQKHLVAGIGAGAMKG